jgi:ArsR family transcriptional regulator
MNKNLNEYTLKSNRMTRNKGSQPMSAPALPHCHTLLKVLADETRLAVVQELLDGPKRVGQINAVLHLEQSLLSHHLRTLRESGLVIAERDGKTVLYRLAPGVESRRTGKAVDLGCCLISFK